MENFLGMNNPKGQCPSGGHAACSLWKESKGVTGTMVGETTSPGFQVGRAQIWKQNRGRPQEVYLASDRLVGGPGLPSEPLCLVGLGVRQMGILGSSPSFVKLLKIYSLSPAFPAMVRQCVKGSDQQ